jgi:hypothetical protein
MFIFLFTLVAVAIAINVNTPEQYATVLASNLWTPPLLVQSPFLGILYLTVTPLPNPTQNMSLNMFVIESLLYHNVDYATDASVWGPGPRGSVTEGGGAQRLFLLYPPLKTPGSVSCPLFTYNVVDESIILALRAGDLYAVISSGGIDAGELRGQIETRNDIYYLPLVDPTSPNNIGLTEDMLYPYENTTNFNGTINDSYNLSVTGAALIRTYNDYPNCGTTLRQPALNSPVAIDYYILSSTGYAQSFMGVPYGTGLSAVELGIMPTGVINANLLFDTGSCVQKRGAIEKSQPVFGLNSSALLLYYEVYNFSSGAYNRTFLGQFIRLPLLSVVGNEVFVFGAVPEARPDANITKEKGNGPDKAVLFLVGAGLFIGFGCLLGLGFYLIQ